MNSIVVSLSGYMGSGKDTLGNYLIEKFKFKRLAFADALKDMCAATYDVPRLYFDDRELKETIIIKHNKTPRQMCLDLAVEKRQEDPLVFVKKVLKQIQPFQKYVITDCRYINELTQLRQTFGNKYLPLYIKRFSTPPSDHPSEIGISPINCAFTIDNTGDLVDSTQQLKTIITTYFNLEDY